MEKNVLLSISIFEKKIQILIDFQSSACRNIHSQWKNVRFFKNIELNSLIGTICRNIDYHPPHVEISIPNWRIYDFLKNIDLTSLIGIIC